LLFVFINEFLQCVVRPELRSRGGAGFITDWSRLLLLCRGPSPQVDDDALREAQLASLAGDLHLDHQDRETLLAYCGGDFQAAHTLYCSLRQAFEGFLEPVPIKPSEALVSNGGNTCYVDSLIFAMFGYLDAFDWLLCKPLVEEDRPLILLQAHLRLFVNNLRTGQAIPGAQARLVLDKMRACGWWGGQSSQEDASELLTFILGSLRAPTLPFSENTYHGAAPDKGGNDHRVTCERVIYLSIPTTGLHTVSSLLDSNFFDQIVRGLRRNVSADQHCNVDAFKQMHVLPFWTVDADSKGEMGTYDRHFGTTVIPMILKRYGVSADGTPKRNDRRIGVPLEIDFSNFICPGLGSAPAATAAPGQFRLHLRSAVCHLGRGGDLNSGHYTGMSCADDGWHRLDDLSKNGGAVRSLSKSALVEELSRNAYILFYELRERSL
jgi:hypothetical protein